MQIFCMVHPFFATYFVRASALFSSTSQIKAPQPHVCKWIRQTIPLTRYAPICGKLDRKANGFCAFVVYAYAQPCRFAYLWQYATTTTYDIYAQTVKWRRMGRLCSVCANATINTVKPRATPEARYNENTQTNKHWGVIQKSARTHTHHHRLRAWMGATQRAYTIHINSITWWHENIKESCAYMVSAHTRRAFQSSKYVPLCFVAFFFFTCVPFSITITSELIIPARVKCT